MALIDTPAAANANTYASVAFADAYFATRPNSSKWTDSTTIEKENALYTATSLIDLLFSFEGDISTQTQALRWPRISVYDADDRLLDSTVIPYRVAQATCELAIALLTKDRLKESVFNKYGLNAFKIGPLSANAAAAVRETLVPALVMTILNGLGEYTGEVNPNAPGFFKVYRT